MKLRDVLAVGVTAFVVVFVVQNLHSVEVQVLPWRLSVSAAILTLAPFLAGLLIGRTATLLPGRRSKPASIEQEKEKAPALPSGPDDRPRPDDAEPDK